MPTEANLYLFRGQTDANGVPMEWLPAEPPTAPSGPDDPGDPGEPAIPARHLTKAEYDALSPRTKERVREAKNSQGKPLYEKNEAPAERAGRAAPDGGKE
jgi:hypothetical protein